MSEWTRPRKCPHCGSENIQTTSAPCAVPAGDGGVFTWWAQFHCLRCRAEMAPENRLRNADVVVENGEAMNARTCFVITGECGEYSSATWWVVRVAVFREEAESFLAALEADVRDCYESVKGMRMWDRPPPFGKYRWEARWVGADAPKSLLDPDGPYSTHEYPTYAIEEVPLGHWATWRALGGEAMQP